MSRLAWYEILVKLEMILGIVFLGVLVQGRAHQCHICVIMLSLMSLATFFCLLNKYHTMSVVCIFPNGVSKVKCPIVMRCQTASMIIARVKTLFKPRLYNRGRLNMFF